MSPEEEIMVDRGQYGYTLHITRRDGLRCQAQISNEMFANLRNARYDNRLFMYPVGDFDEVVNSQTVKTYGIMPSYEMVYTINSTSEGIVWEIIDLVRGKFARSNAIPWWRFCQ